MLAQAKGFYERLMAEPPASWEARLAATTASTLTRPAASGPTSPWQGEAPRTGTTSGRPALSWRGSGALLARALSYRGVPYLWGGASRDGLDCSGLIVRTALDLGQRLPHSAAELFGLGEAVADGDLQPGDLVFFANTYKPGISHVGIFEGGTTFLAASSGAGQVTEGNLNHPYYRARYAGARRLSIGERVLQTAEGWLGRADAAGRRLVAPWRLGEP